MQDDLDTSLKKATYPLRQQPVSTIVLSRERYITKHAFNSNFLDVYCAA